MILITLSLIVGILLSCFSIVILIYKLTVIVIDLIFSLFYYLKNLIMKKFFLSWMIGYLYLLSMSTILQML